MTSSEHMTVVDAVERVKGDQFLLPGIQRSFVWSTKQIEALFDSLVRDYPIGSLLLWDTRPADHPQLRFRRFVTDYAGKNTTPVAARPPKAARVFAVLDGQQRLTALNIGIRGTHAASESGAARRLHLDLDYQQTDAGAELDEYRFQFLADGARVDGTWFSVCDAVGLAVDAASLSEAIRNAGHKPTPERRQVLKHSRWP